MTQHVRVNTSALGYDEFCVCLGRKIAWVRRSRGISQKEMSKLCGISPSYLAKIECARGSLGTTLEVIYIISKQLRVDMSSLMVHTEEDHKRVEVFRLKRQILDQPDLEQPTLEQQKLVN